MSILRQGVILVAVPLTFQLAFVVVLFGFQRDQIEAQQLATHTKEVIAQTHEINAGVNEARAGVQRYIITNDPIFADSYRLSRAHLTELFDALSGLVRDNPEQAAQVQVLQQSRHRLVAARHGPAEAVPAGKLSVGGKTLKQVKR